MTDTHRHRFDIDANGSAVAIRGVAGLGEDLAVAHLSHHDRYEVVARNWSITEEHLRAELDVIALDHRTGTVVVVEVKARRDAHRFGGAVCALSPGQRRRIRSGAAAFLRTAHLPYRRVRFDLVAVDLGRDATLTHLLAAW